MPEMSEFSSIPLCTLAIGKALVQKMGMRIVVLCAVICLILASHPALADRDRKSEARDTVDQIRQPEANANGNYNERHRGREGRWGDATPIERSERRRAMREHWDNMTPTERGELRNKLKEHWESMSPKERDMRRHEMRENWKSMSPTRREQFIRDESEDEN